LVQLELGKAVPAQSCSNNRKYAEGILKGTPKKRREKWREPFIEKEAFCRFNFGRSVGPWWIGVHAYRSKAGAAGISDVSRWSRCWSSESLMPCRIFRSSSKRLAPLALTIDPRRDHFLMIGR